MFIEELDKAIVSKLFLLKEDYEFSTPNCIKNLYSLVLIVSKLLPSPLLLIKIMRLLSRINFLQIISSSQNLYSCRDNSVVPYLLKQIFPNRGVILFQNSIRFDYDLRILVSELGSLGIDSKKIEGITFYCWTSDCVNRLKKHFGEKNIYLVDGSYRFNYFKEIYLSTKKNIDIKYDAVFISSYKGICEDRLPIIRKHLNANLIEDVFNKSHDKSAKIFLAFCRERKFVIGVICRNEHPDEERSFYLSIGFLPAELIKIGKTSDRFDSYRAIEQSNTVVGFSSSLLVEAENFMQKKIIAFDIDNKHVFTPPTIDVNKIINITNESDARLKLYSDIAP